MAAHIELEKTGFSLLGKDLAILAAGERDRGGTTGVIRELLSLRGMARTCLSQDGRPLYRFVGLFDNDKAGQLAVKLAREIDNSILEYKDVFRLWPVMPIPGMLDPGAVQRCFEQANASYKGLAWELEDMLPNSFFDAFLSEFPSAVTRSKSLAGKVHRELTRDGKAHFHRFTKLHATRVDLMEVTKALKAIRCYLMLPIPDNGI